MTTTPTYAAGDRVRLTVPDVYHDERDTKRRLGVTLVFRVHSQGHGTVCVTHEPTGRRYVLPVSKITRV